MNCIRPLIYVVYGDKKILAIIKIVYIDFEIYTKWENMFRSLKST